MPEVHTNKKIDAFIFAGVPLAIDDAYAREQLASYLNDLAALQSGVSYSELGISKRREASKSSFLLFSNDNIQSAPQNELRGKQGQLFAHLKLSGVMRMEDGLSSNGIGSLISDLREADSDPTVAGILLEVNSGGGDGQAGVSLMNAISDTKKPVVALVNQAGSAAMWGIASANKRIANGNLSKAGSIGVYSSIDKQYVTWYEENYQDIYSSLSPDKNSEHRQLLAGSIVGIQRTVDAAARIFQKDIKKNLELKGDESYVEQTLSGGMFFAQEAKQRGLVDEIGTFETAVRALASMVRASNKPTTKAEDMKFLDELKSLITKAESTEMTPDLKSEVIAKLDAVQTGVADMETRLAAIEKSTVGDDLQTVINDLKTLNASLEAVKEGQSALKSAQTELETKVAEVAGKPIAGKANGAADASATEKSFLSNVKTFKAERKQAEA